MKKIILLFAFASAVLLTYAQCEKTNPGGLELIIKPIKGKVYNQLEVKLKNNTDTDLSFCWYDLERTWGLPLCFLMSAWDAEGNQVLDRFNWTQNFNPNMLDDMGTVSEKIDIESMKSYSKPIVVYWKNVIPGQYKIQLFYKKDKVEFASEIVDMQIK